MVHSVPNSHSYIFAPSIKLFLCDFSVTVFLEFTYILTLYIYTIYFIYNKIKISISKTVK